MGVYWIFPAVCPFVCPFTHLSIRKQSFRNLKTYWRQLQYLSEQLESFNPWPSSGKDSTGFFWKHCYLEGSPPVLYPQWLQNMKFCWTFLDKTGSTQSGGNIKPIYGHSLIYLESLLHIPKPHLCQGKKHCLMNFQNPSVKILIHIQRDTWIFSHLSWILL